MRVPLPPPQDPPSALRHLTAINIMRSPVVGFDAIVSVAEVKEVLRRTSHNGFPVCTVRQGGLAVAGGRGAGRSRRDASMARGRLWKPRVVTAAAAAAACRDPVSGRGRLDGFILRSQLLVLLR